MNQQITTELLQSLHACQSGIDLVATYPDKDHEAVIRRLVADDHWDYANWLLPRLMDYKGYVSYAVFAALQVIDIFEKQYPDDKRPRLAIEAAQRCIDDPSDENRLAADSRATAWAAAVRSAMAAAREAAWTAAAASAAAAARAAAADSRAALVAAADSRAAATRAARLAAWTTTAAAAAEAAWTVATWAAWANPAETEKIKNKIIEKGLEILKK